MATELPRSKVDAIYDLRAAVEAKASAEQAWERDGSPAAQDALLEAQLDVEAKTQDAIEICHECGHANADGHAHPAAERIHARFGNVVRVDFSPPDAEGAS
jgi:hypothetical protein